MVGRPHSVSKLPSADNSQQAGLCTFKFIPAVTYVIEQIWQWYNVWSCDLSMTADHDRLSTPYKYFQRTPYMVMSPCVICTDWISIQTNRYPIFYWRPTGRYRAVSATRVVLLKMIRFNISTLALVSLSITFSCLVHDLLIYLRPIVVTFSLCVVDFGSITAALPSAGNFCPCIVC